MPGAMPGGSARRICSSWARAAICWANKVVWIPWNRPSSQPTSCAWATRSSASLGRSSSANGKESRSSSETSSGASPSSSSLIELWWISLSLALLFSSSGAARTSSSSWRIMLPIRMTLAGCSTISITGRSELPGCSASSSGEAPSTGRPFGPTTTTLGRFPKSAFIPSLIFLVYRTDLPSRATGPMLRRRSLLLSSHQQYLAGLVAGLEDPVRLGGAGHRDQLIDHGNQLARGSQRPDIFPHRRHDGGLLRHGPGPQRGGMDAGPLALQDAEVELRAVAALPPDDHQAAAGREGR